MIGAKSQDSTLTSKAYYTTEDYDWIVRISTSGQWNIIDNYTIMAHYNGGASIPQGYEYLTWDSLVFNGYSGLNYALEYSVRVYQYNTSTVLFESGWVDNNQLTYIVSRDWSPNGLNKMQAIDVYVRRKEFDDQGNRRYLVPSDMRPSGFTMKFKGYTNIEEQTLPNDWFATTTQTNLFIPLVTVTTPIETYQGSHGGGGGERGVVYDLNYYLEIPQEVAGVVSYIFYLFGQIASLKYVTTLICLAMVLGTLRFIMR